MNLDRWLDRVGLFDRSGGSGIRGLQACAMHFPPSKEGEVAMSSVFLDGTLEALTERWWVPVLRGIAAILFGTLALIMPSVGLLALVIIWGTYAIANGVLALVVATSAERAGTRFGWYIFEGLVSIAAGVLTFAYPGITGFALLMIIAVWAVVTGAIEIGAAIQLRRVMRGEWLLGLAGLLSIAFGVLMFVHPGAGALAITWLIGAYAIFFGVLQVSLGMKLHHLGRDHDRRILAAPVPA
jgi:uncharacterized membrane protein HdeD (DUF308 family)